MFIIKYGTYYITWLDLDNCEFGVGERNQAKRFAEKQTIDEICGMMGLYNYEVERV